MKLKQSKRLTLYVVFVWLAACTDQHFSVAPDSNAFGQKVKYQDKIDILWVVDNSSSMAKHQNSIAQHAHAFIDKLLSTGLDFRIAVTTTDMSSKADKVCDPHAPDPAKGRFVGPVRIMTRSTPSLFSRFSSAIKQGQCGSTAERGLEAMETALSLQENQDFLRDESMLVVIFLSDEDDKVSPNRDYIEFLNSIKPPFENGMKNWMASFIGILDSNDPTCVTFGSHIDAGVRYLELVDFSSGNKESICDGDLASALTHIQRRILEFASEFHLNREPLVESIRVYVNGNLIEEDEENGWTYIPEGFTIRFHGSAIPSVDAKIVVHFQPAGIT